MNYKDDATFNSNRLATADILKVLSIFAVVFIHGSTAIPSSKLGLNPINLKWMWPSLFYCVPVFVFLWAYFMELSWASRGTFNIWNRFNKLLIPFAFWSLIYFLLLADFKSINIVRLITTHWLGYGWPGQYYFIILFQLILLFPIIHRLSHKLFSKLLYVYVFSIVLNILIAYSGWADIGFVEKIGDKVFIYWLPYVFLGIIYANRKFTKRSFVLIFILFSLIIIPLEVFYLHPHTLRSYLTPSVFASTMVMVTVIMGTYLSYKSIPRGLAILIRDISANTLGIFCLNPLVIISLNYAFKYFGISFSFPFNFILLPILSLFLVTAICMLIVAALKQVRLGFLVGN